MDCAHNLRDRTPGALWKRVNAQHGLLDWSLGELSGIPDTSSNCFPETGHDHRAWLPPITILPANTSTLAVPVPVSVVAGVTTERVKLTLDQAIHIFKLGRTKTARTAAQLATEYGITPKAIRDIWTKKSWAQDTRPYWSVYQVASRTAFVLDRRGNLG